MVPPEIVREPCRRFTVGDAMLLIAAGAVGLALARSAILYLWISLSSMPIPALDTWSAWRQFLFGPNQLVVNSGRFGNLILLNFLVCLIPALVLIRLRRPRPSIGRLFRQPGFVACFVPIVTIIVGLILEFTPLPDVVFGLILSCAAPLSWLILIVTRTWQAEPGWIDRLGRVVGIIFMISSPAHFVLMSNLV